MNDTEQLNTNEEVVVTSPEIAFPLSDDELNALLDRKISETKAKRGTLDLDKRSKKNWDFFKGNQIAEDSLDTWQLPFVDNVIYDNTNYRIVMAASRIPDITIISPNEDTQSQDNAEDIRLTIESRIKSRAVKSMVKKGLLHLHNDFLGCMKVRWDKNKAKNGDYVFDIVNMKDLDIDMSATIPDDEFTSDNMEVIIEWITEPPKVIFSKFPAKKKDLMEALGVSDGKELPAKIRYAEAHFTYYTDAGERMEGVAWRYNKVILDKIKSPNYDWQGYQGASDKPALNDDGTIVQHPMTGSVVYQQDTFYRNFFEIPRKPYIFFSYLNDNDAPTEISTPVEQSISLQRNINRRGRQITEISDNAVPKLAFNGRYITKEATRDITKDPNQHVWIPNEDEASDTPISDMVMQFEGTQPSPELLVDMDTMRGRIAQKYNTSNANQRTGAQRESGLSKQITKEVDLAVSDDIIEIVVERVLFEMVSWSLQMMKLNYDVEHYTRTTGNDGKAAYISMHQDKVEDGIVVDVEISATKKAERQSTAQFLAQTKSTDPYSLMEDMDVPNPKVRLQRLLSFQLGQADGYKSYLTDIDIDPNSVPQPPAMPSGGQAPPTAPQQGATPPEGTQMDANQAQKDLEALVQGQQVQPSGAPSNDYVKVFSDFIQSGHLDSLPPEAQQAIEQYVQSLKGLLNPQPPVS